MWGGTYISDIARHCHDIWCRHEPEIICLDRLRPAGGTGEEDGDLGLIETVGQDRAVRVEGRD